MCFCVTAPIGLFHKKSHYYTDASCGCMIVYKYDFLWMSQDGHQRQEAAGENKQQPPGAVAVRQAGRYRATECQT